MSWLVVCPLFFLIFFLFAVTCFTFPALNITVRLSDGPRQYAGRVEVKYNGTWGSVCEDRPLDINVGHVICRQLGYPKAIATPCCNAFGPGTSPFRLTGVKCKGNESSLAECEYENWGKDICNKYLRMVAGVVCASPSVSTSKFTTKQFISPNIHHWLNKLSYF